MASNHKAKQVRKGNVLRIILPSSRALLLQCQFTLSIYTLSLFSLVLSRFDTLTLQSAPLNFRGGATIEIFHFTFLPKTIIYSAIFFQSYCVLQH